MSTHARTDVDSFDSLFPLTRGAEEEDQIEKPHELLSGDFFQEVLFTFCLLFGQQKASRDKFKEHQKKSRSLYPDNAVDPLLKELCTTPWGEGSLQRLLDFNGVKRSYSAKTDFPFFADRLQIMQEYTSNIDPDDWRSHWQDRRDLTRFYTVWPALIFGIVALGMGLIQILLSVAQVVAGFTRSGQ